MKLTQRHRHNRFDLVPRISISEAEIAADLEYPAKRRPDQQARPARRRARRR